MMWWWGICAASTCTVSDALCAGRADQYEVLFPILTDERPGAHRPHGGGRHYPQLTADRHDASKVAPGIYVARNVQTQEFVALKVFDKSLLRRKAIRRRMRHEVQVLSRMRDHPNILNLHGVYSAGRTFEIAFELARGGEVIQRVLHDELDLMGVAMTEREVSRVVGSVASALEYMHDQGLVHGEVRPEHILYADSEPDAKVVLGDFGRAASAGYFSLESRSHQRGRFQYMWEDLHDLRFLPPFVVQGKQNAALDWSRLVNLDIWALGVTMYVLLFPRFPFTGETVGELQRQICEGDLAFPEEDSDLISRAAKDLLCRLLSRTGGNQMTIQDVLSHPWICSQVASSAMWPRSFLRKRREFVLTYNDEVSCSTLRRRTSESASFFRTKSDKTIQTERMDSTLVDEEPEQRPSFVSTGFSQLQALECELPETAESLMRQASGEFFELANCNHTPEINSQNIQRVVRKETPRNPWLALFRRQRTRSTDGTSTSHPSSGSNSTSSNLEHQPTIAA